MSLGQDVRSKRFVLIDDDPSYRALILRAAGTQGMNFDAFESIHDLGSVALLGRYDAAIVDYDLGDVTGVELAEDLAACFGYVPMVLVSEKVRTHDGARWPEIIKSFVKKSDGHVLALMMAKMVASSRSCVGRTFQV